MSVVNRLISLSCAAAALVACAPDASDQDVLITNEVPANAEVEVLPPDESVTTPSDDLARDAADSQVDDTSLNGS